MNMTSPNMMEINSGFIIISVFTLAWQNGHFIDIGLWVRVECTKSRN